MSSSAASQSVAVAGITGKLGRLLAHHLLSYDGVYVHGIGRNPDKLPDNLKYHARMKLFKSNMTDTAELGHAVRGCSVLVSVVLSDPGTDIAMQKAMIDACVAEHVPRFLPNDFTFDWRTADLDNLLPQKKVNDELVRYLEKYTGRIQGVHVLIGAFMETIFSAGFWFPPDKSPAEGISSWGTGDEIWELTSYDNTAAFTAAVALDKNANGFLNFLGDRLTLKQVAKVLEEVYDLPPVPFSSRGTLNELESHVREGIKKDPDSDDFWAWKAQSYSLFLLNGVASLRQPLDTAKFADKVTPLTLKEWLQQHKIEELNTSAWTL